MRQELAAVVSRLACQPIVPADHVGQSTHICAATDSGTGLDAVLRKGRYVHRLPCEIGNDHRPTAYTTATAFDGGRFAAGGGVRGVGVVALIVVLIVRHLGHSPLACHTSWPAGCLSRP